jgi:hypothetical protein
MAPMWPSQSWRRRFRCGNGQFSPRKIPIGERDNKLDDSYTRFYIPTVYKYWAAPNGHCRRWQLDESGLRRWVFLSWYSRHCLYGTITIEHACCSTIPESYGGNTKTHVVRVGLLLLYVGCGRGLGRVTDFTEEYSDLWWRGTKWVVIPVLPVVSYRMKKMGKMGAPVSPNLVILVIPVIPKNMVRV